MGGRKDGMGYLVLSFLMFGIERFLGERPMEQQSGHEKSWSRSVVQCETASRSVGGVAIGDSIARAGCITNGAS